MSEIKRPGRPHESTPTPILKGALAREADERWF
jgi:hypothetical protein